jgi:hypothetical protein
MNTQEKIQELEKQINELKKERMEEWFKSLLNGLEIEIDDKKPDVVFYKKIVKLFLRYIKIQIKHIFIAITIQFGLF